MRYRTIHVWFLVYPNKCCPQQLHEVLNSERYSRAKARMLLIDRRANGEAFDGEQIAHIVRKVRL